MFCPDTDLTINNAKTVLEAGLRAIAAGQTQIDLATLAVVDSAAVATLLAWQRSAQKSGRPVRFLNIPANLQALLQLYGLTHMLRH